MFKLRPPLDPVENGYGFNGVILRDKKKDKIQCHLCGKWLTQLGIHLRWSHKIGPEEYRFKYSLPIGFPLCGKNYSKKRSDIACRLGNMARINGWKGKGAENLKKKVNRKKCYWTKSCLAIQNMKGACPKQIVDRYVVVSDQAGGEASVRTIEKYDPPLMGLIIRRYGNINNFREKNGFNVNPRAKIYKKQEIISAIRKYAIDHHKVPSIMNFKLSNGKFPGWTCIKRLFGSWRRALSVAGYEHFYRKRRYGM